MLYRKQQNDKEQDQSRWCNTTWDRLSALPHLESDHSHHHEGFKQVRLVILTTETKEGSHLPCHQPSTTPRSLCPPLMTTAELHAAQNNFTRYRASGQRCSPISELETHCRQQVRHASLLQDLVSASLTLVSPGSSFKRRSPSCTRCCTDKQRVCTCRRRPSPRRGPTANQLDEFTCRSKWLRF